MRSTAAQAAYNAAAKCLAQKLKWTTPCKVHCIGQQFFSITPAASLVITLLLCHHPTSNGVYITEVMQSDA